MKRKFRLTRSTNFKRVRRLGKSYAHPLVVLVALPNEVGSLPNSVGSLPNSVGSLPNEVGHTRFGVSAGRSVGNAVQRNRAKRLLREALRPCLPTVISGWDVVLLARQPLLEASFQEVQSAVKTLLQRARIYKDGNPPHSS